MLRRAHHHPPNRFICRQTRVRVRRWSSKARTRCRIQAKARAKIVSHEKLLSGSPTLPDFFLSRSLPFIGNNGVQLRQTTSSLSPQRPSLEDSQFPQFPLLSCPCFPLSVPSQWSACKFQSICLYAISSQKRATRASTKSSERCSVPPSKISRVSLRFPAVDSPPSLRLNSQHHHLIPLL